MCPLFKCICNVLWAIQAQSGYTQFGRIENATQTLHTHTTHTYIIRFVVDPACANLILILFFFFFCFSHLGSYNIFTFVVCVFYFYIFLYLHEITSFKCFESRQRDREVFALHLCRCMNLNSIVSAPLETRTPCNYTLPAKIFLHFIYFFVLFLYAFCCLSLSCSPHNFACMRGRQACSTSHTDYRC